MGKYDDKLNNAIRSGRLIGEDGEMVNEADLLTQIKDGIGGGFVTIQSFTGSGTATHTVTEGVGKEIAIANDGISDLTFTINSIVVTVLAGESYGGKFASFTEIIVTNAGGSDYRITVAGV